MTNHCMSRAVRVTVMALTLAGLIPAAMVTTGCLADRQREIETQRTQAFDIFSQGEELERRGDVGKAIEYYARAAEISPRPAFFAQAGRAHATLGQHAQAVHFFDLALQLNPDYEVAKAQRELSVLAMKREESEGTAPLALANVLQDPAVAQAPAAPEAPVAPVAPVPPARPQADSVVREAEVAVTEPVPAAEVATTPATETAPTPVFEPAPSATSASVAAVPTPVAAPAVSAAPASALVVTPVAALDEEQLVADLSMDTVLVNPGDLPPRRVRAPGEGLDREAIRTSLFAHVLELDAEELQIEAWAAQAASDARRWDEATRRWERVVSQRPEDVEALVRLGDALQQSGRGARAWEVFRRAAALAPEDPAVFREWGNALVRAKEFDQAAEKYETAKRLAPDMVEVRNNLAAIDIERGQGDRAVSDLRNLLAERPDFAPAWLNLAIALDRTGADTASRISALETYLKLDGSRDAEAERWILELRSSGK